MHASQLELVTPCTADWSAMPGNERKRFCADCSKHVHDLSEHTEAEAMALVQQPEVCGIFRSDPESGEVLFRPSRLKRLAVAAASMLAVTAPALADTPQTPSSPSHTQSAETTTSPWSRLVTWLTGDDVRVAEADTSEVHSTDTPLATSTSSEEMPPMPGGLKFHPTPQPPAVPVALPPGGVSPPK